MTTTSSFDDRAQGSGAYLEIVTANAGTCEQLVLPRPDAPKGTLVDRHEVSPGGIQVDPAGSVQSRWAWILLVAALPIGFVTGGLMIVTYYGVLGGEGMGSDVARQVMNTVLFTSVLVPTFLGAVFGALGWRKSSRMPPAIAAALNALLASLMIGMIVGYTETPPLVVSIAMGLVLMIAVLLGVARPWQKRDQDEDV